MDSSDDNRIRTFIEWLQGARGVTLNPSISIQSLGDEGHGLIATADLEPGTVLFSIPRPPAENSPLLTIGTSTFLDRLGPVDSKKISRNWVPLLLTMMWERARAHDENSVPLAHSWRPYFEIMPTTFDTLMFWSDEELKELQASTAEADYHQLVAPLIRQRSDLFPVPISSTGKAWKWDDFYGLEIYHCMGSLVLSRSFEVDVNPENEDETELDAEEFVDNKDENGGDTSMTAASASSRPEEGDDQEEEETSNSEGVAMVPLADMLNAKSGCENAKLFYEPNLLNMTVTKAIKAGEQIYNTYADPPNADLLRRYGHVDDHNPFDLAEVSLELCIKLAAAVFPETKQKQKEDKISRLEARAEWALEMGLDEIFMLPTTTQREPNQVLPSELTTLLRVLLAPDSDFQTWKTKEKLPKPTLSEPIARLASQILSARLAQYPTSIAIDEALLQDMTLPPRKRKAVRVRLGEKTILQETLNDLSLQFSSSAENPKRKKRDLNRKDLCKKSRA
ncbi:hypothetical protein CROQUDRAFT_669256 [Cronartium quercuum f. sp. fusiforme G11]|uniref:Ribosomal lysine N-methyltransferase 4 n=1 Tax=Cronartium quercuum f. sp. fusiforme G11 TaxID=708437 RepID=A0A9P6NTV6_9BASI|nr:hypothetical protein CROQUDRAFT_669256 [Cronartium quercuum f. sp. fusiforme G11]